MTNQSLSENGVDTSTRVTFTNEWGTEELHYEKEEDRSKRYELPREVKVHLIKWMYENQVFYMNNFVPKVGGPSLEHFFAGCGLEDTTKPMEARKFFKNSIRSFAKNFTRQIKDLIGYDGDLIPTRAGQSEIRNARYSRGFEYFSDDHWDGKVVKKFLEPEELNEKVLYGLQKRLYTKDEFDKIASLIAEYSQDYNQSPSSDNDFSSPLSNAQLSSSTPGDATRVGIWLSSFPDTSGAHEEVLLPSAPSTSCSSAFPKLSKGAPRGKKRSAEEELETIPSISTPTPSSTEAKKYRKASQNKRVTTKTFEVLSCVTGNSLQT